MLNFVVVGAVVSVVVAGRWSVWNVGRRGMGLAMVVGCLVAVVILWEGMLAAQRAVVNLVMPAGLIWMVLLGATLLAFVKRQRVVVSWLLPVLMLYSVLGNGTVAAMTTRWLEQPFVETHPLEQGKFDAVLVLGGGAGMKPQGYAQLHAAGDRVALGARLFNLGKADRLVSFGAPDGNKPTWARDPSDVTREIWEQMGVPADVILPAEGRNTKEELADAARLIAEHRWERVGLVTSAWHMRRAMRHARRLELDLTPLPADFQSGPVSWRDVSIVPTGWALGGMHGSLKEILAMCVGR